MGEMDNIRNYLMHEGIVENSTDEFYKIISNFHPEYIYFMFIYKINKYTLSLESFSHPFIIIKDLNTSFLMFPLGLTVTNYTGREPQILLSYGDGDCTSYLASFTKEKFNILSSQNNNNTDSNNLEFWTYNNE